MDTVLRSTLAALATCDIAVPAAAQQWIDIATQLEAEAEADNLRSRENAHTAADSLTTDNVAEVLDTLTRAKLEAETRHFTARQLGEQAGARALRAIRAEADLLVTLARPAFDQAAKSLSKTAAAFPADANPTAVLALGPDAAKAWATIEEASAALDLCETLRGLVYDTGHRVSAVVATFDGDHWRRVDAEAAFQQPNRWHALVAADYTLRLNTLTEEAALLAATPEKQLRTEYVPLGAGVRGMQTVRG